MGKSKTKPRVIPEQDGRIIGTICVCQLTLVLSGVALVYLSVAVYAPSHRAFHSGFDPEPVMCETVNTTMAGNCAWASCGEWCLTRTSGFCPQMHVTVRRNGSRLTLHDCSLQQQVNCPAPNFGNLKRSNCNNDTECTRMAGLFNCTLGHCANLSEVVLCSNRGEGHAIDVDKDAGKLTGNYECHMNRCTKLKRALDCERLCPRIGTRNVNVFVKVLDSVLGANCRGATVTDPSAPGPAPAPLWAPPDGVLLANCHTVQRLDTTVIGTDCINGTTVVPQTLPQPFMNYSQLRIIWQESMDSLPSVPRRGWLLPPSPSLALQAAPSRLHINLAGCVNTLKGECVRFLAEYGADGRGHAARSRFPCFRNPNDTSLVLARFDLQQTWRELVVAVFVPAVLFVVSLTTLCVITRSVKVGDDAKLRCLACCCSGGSSGQSSTPT